MLSHPRSWRAAWAESAYASGGFWHTQRPGEHFRTAVASSPLIADTLVRLLARFPAVRTVIDIGAGGGDLLGDLNRRCPGFDLVGIDLVERPRGLPPDVSWYVDLWDVDQDSWTTGAAEVAYAGVSGPALLVACEWLDDLPCTLAVRLSGVGDEAPRELLVDDGGTERAGLPVGREEEAWTRCWWPSGERLEIGLSRDRAWARALARLPYGGLGLMIDYGHVIGARPAAGTLAAYRAGRRLPPSPSTRSNITAHVAVDAVQHAGHAVGAHTLLLQRQAQVQFVAAGGSVEGQPGDPRAGLDRLVRSSQHRALTDPAGWGSHWWLLQSVPAAGVVD